MYDGLLAVENVTFCQQEDRMESHIFIIMYL
jgi:hypothetical protein